MHPDKRRALVKSIAEALGRDGCTEEQVLRAAVEELQASRPSPALQGDDRRQRSNEASSSALVNGSTAHHRRALNGAGSHSLPKGKGAAPLWADLLPADLDSWEDPLCLEDTTTTPKPVPHLDALGWLMHPTPSESWWRDDFERRPALVSRPCCRSYFANLFQLADFEAIVKRERLQYGLDLDVARYDGAVRETLNSNGGEACEEHALIDPGVAWRRFESEGCSLRLLHPQRFDARVRALVSALESQTGCVGGCNLYLTPPGSQGFAPHWDDVDAFVLQLHGQKTWRLYAAPDAACVLPRRSSVDFARDALGPCLLERTLRPGDVLYLPRGLVHEARAEGAGEELDSPHVTSEPSLHATVSAHQRWTWADLLERAAGLAVASLAASCQGLRRTLPRSLAQSAMLLQGLGPPDAPPAAAAAARVLLDRAQALARRAVDEELPGALCAAADEMAASFVRARLPPLGANAENRAASRADLADSTRLKLNSCGQTLFHLCRTPPGGELLLSHCMQNAWDAHCVAAGGAEEDPAEEACVECDPALAEGVVLLLAGMARGRGSSVAEAAARWEAGDARPWSDKRRQNVCRALTQLAQALRSSGLLVQAGASAEPGGGRRKEEAGRPEKRSASSHPTRKKKRPL